MKHGRSDRHRPSWRRGAAGVLGLLFLTSCTGPSPQPRTAPEPAERPALPTLEADAGEPRMVAHFIDVGQANATLLEFPCGAVLVDAGAQDEEHVAALVDYLSRFFDEQRPDLGRTLDSILITHNHIDHTRALRAVVENFTVERYFDNGQLSGFGTENPLWVRAEAAAGRQNVRIREIDHDPILAVDPPVGLTDADVDPVDCPEVDPEIKILSGRRTRNPGWEPQEFNNKNNHSLVIRVDFGDASYLFPGDLETPGIEVLLDEYGGTDLLDVDVYEVGHHGSRNGTTSAFARRMTPEIAVISVGRWDFGRGTDEEFSTFFFGHPRRQVLNLLNRRIRRERNAPIRAMIADAVKDFSPSTIRKAIYATGWEGTVRIESTADGRHTVTSSAESP
jgi:competence protein ComEC